MSNSPFVDAFTHLRQLVAEHARRQEVDPDCPPLCDLSIGNPDIGPSDYWLEQLASTIADPTLQGYGEFRPDVARELRHAFCRYYQRRHQPDVVTPLLDPDRHVLELQGSKEGIYHLLATVLGPGDAVLLPEVSYSVYKSCAERVGGHVEYFPCDARGQPDCSRITAQQLQRARILVVCSPNNPTGTLLSSEVLDQLVQFTARHQLCLVVDRAYAEIGHPGPLLGRRGGAALCRQGALEHVVELHSLSKSCGVAGWRLGFAAGAPALLDRMREAKMDCDFGGYLPLQRVATQMLDTLESTAAINSERYRRRAIQFARSMAEAGWSMPLPDGGFFIWAEVPSCYAGNDLRFVAELLRDTGVLVAPGSGFGPGGARFVRIAMVQPLPAIVEAAERIGEWLGERRLALAGGQGEREASTR